MIDHPAYYREDTGHEAIAVIEAWGLGFRLGNAVKYISRAGLKGSRLDDLRKARWYLDREIQAMEAEADEEAAKAQEAVAASRFRAVRKGDKVGIVDEDGDARWIILRGEANRIADTIRWGLDHADEEPTAIFEGGAPEIWREGDAMRVRWDSIDLRLSCDDARELMNGLWKAAEEAGR